MRPTPANAPLPGATSVLVALVTSATFAAIAASASPAHADEWILKNPGDHPPYVIELEPEAIVAFGEPLDRGPGAGLRASIPLMHNGFVKSINDVPALSFGLSRTPLVSSNALYAPVVLAWTFYLSRRWSVLGEGGAFFVFGGDGKAHLEPALMAGAQFHFTERVALTARVSVPGLSALGVGVSFFL
jgi:hypothetical protein